MPKRTHDWNNLQNYLTVHEKVLKKYSSAFSNQPHYTHEWVTDQWLILRATLHFQPGRVKLEIVKHVEVRIVGRLKSARTNAYSYNVSDNVGNLLRYDSPHPHRPYHHRHEYDLSVRRQVAPPKKLKEEEVPHVSDVIDEIIALIHRSGDDDTQEN